MKKLYLTTILFNFLGSMMSLSLFFLGKSFLSNYFPIVIGVCVIFILSLTFAITDYRRMMRAPKYINYYKPAITNYKDYFTSQKCDFIIYQ